jgi:lipopolysaccharide export system permease protein
MTLPELRRAVQDKTAAGETSFPEQVELHRKFSIPFACFVFAAVGLPLGIQPARGVRARGFSVSLVLIFLYYIMLSLAESLGERGKVPPLLALWTPNLVFGAAGAYLFFEAARERRPSPLSAIEAWAAALRTRVSSRFTPAG